MGKRSIGERAVANQAVADPVAALFKPPRAALLPSNCPEVRNAIDRLDVTDKWKRVFHLIAIGGGPSLSNAADLSRGERMKVKLNVLAYIFGVLYYIAKGMWRRGLTLLLISNMIAFAIAFVLAVFGMMNLLPASQWIAAVVFAVRANRDFYRYKVLGENGWL